MPFKHKSSPYYYFDRSFKINGERYRVRGSTGESSKVRAREIEEAAVRAEKDRILYGAKRKQLTLENAVGTYVRNVSAYQPSLSSTMSFAASVLKGIPKKTLLPDLTAAMITKHVTIRRASVANASVNREIELLQRVVAYAGANLDAAIPDIDWKALKLKEAALRVRELSEAEEGRLFAALRPDFHTFVKFAIITGARISSITELEWSDIDFDARILTFKTMKGGDVHKIPMWSELLILLASQSRPNEYVFNFEGKGGPRKFTQPATRKPWRDALKLAGITNFRFHDLRHTAASRITRTRGIFTAQHILGHKSLLMTTNYAHTSISDLRNAMENSNFTRNAHQLTESK